MKKFIWLLVVLVLLGGYIFVFENPFKEKEKQEAEQNISLYGIKERHIFYIDISNPGEEKIELLKKNNSWFIKNADNYFADNEIVSQVVESILALKKGPVISNNSNNWSKFEVTPETGIEVVVKNVDARELAHFFIGKNGPSYASQYIRRNNLDNVILQNQNLKMHFSRPLDAWKDRTILSLEKENINTIKVAAKDSTENFELIRSGTGWLLNEEIVDQPKVDVVLNAVTDLKTTDFPKTEIEVTAENADYVVEVVLTNNSSQKLLIQATDTEGAFYVKLENNPTLFSISSVQKEEIINQFTVSEE